MAQYDELRQRATHPEQDYLSMLRKLLPRGPIWGFDQRLVAEILQDVPMPGDDPLQVVPEPGDNPGLQNIPLTPDMYTGSVFGRFFACLAAELARVEERAYALYNEAIPGISDEMLPDWERVLGLPNHCTLLVSGDMDARRRAAHAKMYGEYQTATFQYFIDYGASLGFELSLEEGAVVGGTPSAAGTARTGRTRLANRGARCVYIVHVVAGPADPNVYAQLQCIFYDIKPAHVVFVWSDERV